MAAYTIEVQARDNPPTYTLRGLRSTGSMNNDRCGTLTLTSNNRSAA